MFSAFVLVLVLESGISMQEFSSKESCVAAGEVWLNKMNDVHFKVYSTTFYLCVEK